MCDGVGDEVPGLVVVVDVENKGARALLGVKT